ncbi:MAG: DUF6198 family protein [Firmicutes bacterium]|nr:DUF6198 family protein [Bacillota bacterium]
MDDIDTQKRICVSAEAVYVVSLLILSLSVAMTAASNYGVSMIVAPAYIIWMKLSESISWITFGQCEYIVQGALFILFCILMKRVKIVYFSSFLTGVIYGLVLDMWRLIPVLNPDVTEPGSLPAWQNVILFALGMVMTSFSISLFFKTYLYPQVYDFFVKGITAHYNLDRGKFKTAFDFTCLGVSLLLSFVLFGKIVAVGVGTVIITCFNGLLISLFGRLTDKFITVKPTFENFAEKFALQ